MAESLFPTAADRRRARDGFDFTGRVVVITGGAGGLAAAVASAFTDAGATVVGIDRPGTDAEIPLFTADLTDAVAVERAFEEIEKSAGSPDIVVNNAGIREIKAITDLSPTEWDRVIDINLNGAYYVAREAALRMRRGSGGSIVNVSSVAGLLGMPSRPAYSASKHAIVGLTRNLAADLAPYGIRVNAVAPGTVRTALTEVYYADEGFLTDVAKTVPLGADGTVDDVANAILFLASPLAAFITGVVLPVDGGFTMTKSYSYAEGTAYTDPAAGSRV